MLRKGLPWPGAPGLAWVVGTGQCLYPSIWWVIGFERTRDSDIVFLKRSLWQPAFVNCRASFGIWDDAVLVRPNLQLRLGILFSPVN